MTSLRKPQAAVSMLQWWLLLDASKLKSRAQAQAVESLIY